MTRGSWVTGNALTSSQVPPRVVRIQAKWRRLLGRVGRRNSWAFGWHVDDDVLSMGKSLGWPAGDELEPAALWVLQRTGHSLLTMELRLKITEIQRETIRLRTLDSANRSVILTQVPE